VVTIAWYQSAITCLPKRISFTSFQDDKEVYGVTELPVTW
jgi:hypothetical protein